MRPGSVPALLIALALAGCATGAGSLPGPAFVLAPADPDPAKVTAVGNSSTGASAASGTVELAGRAFVSKVPTDAANVSRQGAVIGSLVTVKDVFTGASIAHTTTFYDGSFVVDIPLSHGNLAVMASVDVVGRNDPRRKATLAAPALLKAGEGTHQVEMRPGSTALMALLNDIAAQTAGAAAVPTPTITPVPGSHELLDLMASFEVAQVHQFILVAEAAPELDHAATINALGTGILAYVSRLREGTHKKG